MRSHSKGCSRCRRNVCCCKGPPGPPGSTGPAAAPESDFLAGAILELLDQNTLLAKGTFGVLGLSEGSQGGQPSWRLTFDAATIEPVPHQIAFGIHIFDVSTPFFQPRMALNVVPPPLPGQIVVDIYLVDAAGNALNPYVVMANPGTAIHLHVHRGGTGEFTSTSP